MIDLDSGKMQEEPGKSVMAKTMMIPATVTLTAFETADLCSTPARHGSMNLFKVHIFSIVHTDIDSTATEWMHQCLQSDAKRIQGHETEPYP